MPTIMSTKRTMSSDGHMICERVVLYEDGSEVTEESYDGGNNWVKISTIFNPPPPILQIKLNPGEAKKIKILPFIKTMTSSTPKLNIKWDTDEPPKIHKLIDPDNSKKEKHFICPGEKCPLCNEKYEKDKKKVTGTTDIDELF